MDGRNIFYTFAVVKNKTLFAFLVLGPGKTYNGNKHKVGGSGLHSKKKPRNAAYFFNTILNFDIYTQSKIR